MKQTATRELFAYWNQLRRERAAPERADVDPAEIRTILSDTFMLETAQSEFALRLTGSRLNALWMDELKGRDFASLWGEDRTSVAAALWTVMDGAVPVVAGAAAAPSGRPPVELEFLFLPLRHQGRTHARILGAVAYAGHRDWLGLMPVERLELRTLRIMSAGEARVDLPIVRRAGGVIAKRPVARPHLRVLPGGRVHL